MINSKFFLGYPIEYQNKFLIYPPKIKDMIGNDEFFSYMNILTMSQEEVEDIVVANNSERIPTPLEFLLANCYNNKEYEGIAKRAFKTFIGQDVFFLYEIKSILIGDLKTLNIDKLENLIMITEDNFFEIQNLFRQALGDKPVEKPNPNEDPRVKRIKAKARYRDKIKAKQGKGISMGTSLVAICCMNFGINPLNIGELSYAAVRYLMEMYQNKEKYETDISSILAGADSKKIKPNYWIRNLE